MNLRSLLRRAFVIRDRYSRPDHPDLCIFCDDSAMEQHHIVPKHLGGPEKGPLVPLCANHHGRLHYYTMKLLSGKTPEEIPFPESQARNNELFLLLCQIIIDATIIREGNLNPNQLRNVGCKIPHSLLIKLHLRKSDLGFSNTGDYLISLIERDVANL
jgi:hypothetical protein